MKRFGFLIVALGMLSLNNCGGTDVEGKCQDECSDSACNGGTAPAAADVASCKSACTAQSKALDASDCKSKFDDFESCAGDGLFACQPTSAQEAQIAKCGTQAQAYSTCIGTYCQNNASSAICDTNN